ncbi:MAG: DUF3369 domain-containing protein [Gammaproteobacteria bacterium]|nr:DUF3369 domain-containing protein [Gammaproteobacteria bacterium]MCL5255694.1 DUF3369 domain-containing protein [Gammaproteobacteria bacterium]
MNDQFLFAEEPVPSNDALSERWKILIVDDEPEVHAVTRLALSDFEFLGRKLEFYSAESGEEGCRLMEEHPDAAIILLDVVMETDDAGLRVAKYIREDLDNHFTRIILRTGQPGQAPERTVIINYDINDYKSKTELTAQKLFTAVMSSLRSYRDIMSIEHSRRGLEKILHATTDLFSEQSMDQLVDGLVQQLSWLIGGARQVLYAEVDREQGTAAMTVRAAFGDEAEVVVQRPLKAALPVSALRELEQVIATREPYFSDDLALVYCQAGAKLGGLLCLSGLARALSDKEQDLLNLFAQQIQLALNNVLREQDTQDFIRRTLEHAQELERDHLFSEDKQLHPAAKVAAVLAQALDIPLERHENLALAAMIAALLAPYSAVAEGCERTQARLGYERLQRVLRGLQNDQTEVMKLVLAAADARFERVDGEGFPGVLQGKGYPLDLQLLVFVMQIFALQSQSDSPQQALRKVLDAATGCFAPELIKAVQDYLGLLHERLQPPSSMKS